MLSSAETLSRVSRCSESHRSPVPKLSPAHELAAGPFFPRMRRFPPPWTVEQIPGGYKVKDANGQALAYVYARETRADADTAKVLTMDEARRIASKIAKLPTLLPRK